jgi:hypothetical protein
MVQRTANLIQKRIDQESMQQLDDDMNMLTSHNSKVRSFRGRFDSRGRVHKYIKPKAKHQRKQRFDNMINGVPLTKRLFELLKKDSFGSEESDGNGEGLDKPKRKKRGPFGKLHPGVYDDKAKRFHGVMSGPFTPHIDREQRNRISFSLYDASHPGRMKSNNRSSKERSSEEGDADFDDEEEEEGLKLPSLIIREKLSPNATARNHHENV